MREKTRAHHRLKDDVPEDVKIARLQELIDVFRVGAAAANAERVGTTQTVCLFVCLFVQPSVPLCCEVYFLLSTLHCFMKGFVVVLAFFW